MHNSVPTDAYPPAIKTFLSAATPKAECLASGMSQMSAVVSHFFVLVSKLAASARQFLSSKPSLKILNKTSILSEKFLNLKNEAHFISHV